MGVTFIQALTRAVLAQLGTAFVAMIQRWRVTIGQGHQGNGVQHRVVIVERGVHLALVNGWIDG